MSDYLLRPRVESNLLNPALIGLTAAYAAAGYLADRSRPMPWPAAFLIPPLVLHRPTRSDLPSDARTHFASWVSRHPSIVAGFPRRAAVMAEPTREGLRVVLRAGRIELSQGAIRPLGLANPPQGELGQLLRTSRLVGRLLARLDQPSTAFALLGVSP
jgi:Family of unknown function (DUF6521)